MKYFVNKEKPAVQLSKIYISVADLYPSIGTKFEHQLFQNLYDITVRILC